VFDPLMTLLAAKAKAVGLVAGTALATSAVVGGGAVAMTAVSHETGHEDAPVVADCVDGAATGDADVCDAPDVTATDADAALDEGEEGIEEGVTAEDVALEDGEELDEPGTGILAGFPCPEDVKNHGEYVSSVARSKGELSGREHGARVSAAAKSDCGKEKSEDESLEEDSVATESDETEVVEDEASEEKSAKSPAKSGKKGGKAHKQSKGKGGSKAGGGKGGAGKGGKG
jgi:hypothetical protein